jgi:hypothetical protein
MLGQPQCRDTDHSSATGRGTRRREGSLDAIRRNIQVGNRSYRRGSEHAEPHAVARERPGDKGIPGEAGATYVENHDVGLHPLRVQCQPRDLGEPMRQLPRSLMILCQSVDIMPERKDAGGGNDAGLAHGASKKLLEAPGFLDEIAGSGQHRAYRCAEPLAEVDPERIKVGREGSGCSSAGNYGVEQPGAIHVGHQPPTVRRCTDLLDLRQRPAYSSNGSAGLLD